MATRLSLGDILSIRYEFASTSNVAYNVMHYRCDMIATNPGGLPPAVPPLISDVADPILAEMMDLVVDAWEPTASTGSAMTGATIQDLLPTPRSRPFTSEFVAPRPGTVASEPLPSQDAATLIKITEFGQRWGLGRWYHFGLPESLQSHGFVTPAGITALQHLADVLDSPVTMTIPGFDLTLRPVLLHTEIREGQRYHPILGMQLSNNVIKTQRRRRPGKGI